MRPNPPSRSRFRQFSEKKNDGKTENVVFRGFAKTKEHQNIVQLFSIVKAVHYQRTVHATRHSLCDYVLNQLKRRKLCFVQL